MATIVQRVERSDQVDGVVGEACTSVFPSPYTARAVVVQYYAITGNDQEWPIPSQDSALRGEDHIALVAVWDNDDDAIYDTI